MTSESDTLARLLAYHDHIDVPHVAIEDDVRRGRRRVRRNRGLIAGGAALAVATVVAASSLLSGGERVQKPQPMMPSPTSTEVQSPGPTESVTPEQGWPAAVRDGTSWPRVTPKRAEVGSHLGLGSDALGWVDDASDAEGGLVDIRYVASPGRFSVDGHAMIGEWRISLAKRWPGRSEIGPADGVVEYGVVVDSDDDQVADCQIGINDGAQRLGDYRVWVTNLRTGITKEQVGAPYGVPIDFALPDETGEYVAFFFLTHGQPCDFRGPIHYYAYASATDVDGHVTAWDFAPDAAWLEGTADESACCLSDPGQ